MPIRMKRSIGVKKSKNQWLREGDKNTKFFHASVIQRRKHNRIDQLERETRGACTTEDEMVEEMLAFYSDLFTSQDAIGWEDKLRGISSTITDTMNSRLIRPLEESEIKKAVFSMSPNKAPGMDAELDQVRCITQILEDYEVCSGQKVNLIKSSLFFRKNVQQQIRRQICQELDGITVQEKYKYLGLPLVIGRSKAQAFKFVEDAAVRKISSWKNNFLSQAGKEVLLKSVVMSLPIYIMSCYKLPGILCHEIERRMTKCWWGDTDGKNKMHWAK